MQRTGMLMGAVLGIGAVMAAAPALGQSARGGDALDVPEQIAPAARPSVGADQVAPAQEQAEEKVRVEEIAPEDGGDPTRVEQSTGGRDLCDPSVSEEVRRRYGVDCDELERRERAEDGARGRAADGTVEDSLLQPRDRGAERQFEDLEIDDDVPPTFILQN